ncbi:MAG: F0F1 ATP synthase subunit A [Rhodothermales bacterium]|nr:F0F1 ATP synthase subunit A [Rhodothermales bacterium]MBO6778334.1 F0F1 ATP synthase subunit A [Rhodothermales bacterium]
MIKSSRFGFSLLAALLFAASGTPAFAAAEGEELDVVGHSSDGYYWDFSPGPKVELPRIFIVRDAEGGLGVDFFWSSTSAVLAGNYVATWEDAGKDDPADVLSEELTEPADDDAEVATEERTDYYYAALAPPAGTSVVLDMSITRQLLFAWFGMIIVFLLFTSMARKYKAGVGRTSAPKGRLQNTLETLVLFVRDEIARPNLADKTDKYLPYLLTVFFFILTCNLIGLVPFGATATSNIMVTAVLATITFVLTQLGGTKDHWAHVFNPPGVPGFVKPILVPVELLGLFTKPIALAIRLFANMTAGHLIILSLIGLIFTFGGLFGTLAGYGVAPVSIAFSLFIYCLELLVSFIQAYVFTMLSALFIGMAVVEHHHDHDEDHHHAPALAELGETVLE